MKIPSGFKFKTIASIANELIRNLAEWGEMDFVEIHPLNTILCMRCSMCDEAVPLTEVDTMCISMRDCGITEHPHRPGVMGVTVQEETIVICKECIKKKDDDDWTEVEEVEE